MCLDSKLFALGMILAITARVDSRAQTPKDEPGTALDVKANEARTFYVDGRAGNNQVTFLSESTLEDFTGVCNKVGGELKVDPRSVESLSGRVALKIKDMDTGIDLRNEHMASPEWFDAEKYPEVVVEFEKADEVKKTGANQAELTLVAKLSMHGVTQDMRIPGTLTYLDESAATQRRVKGDIVRLRAHFDVTLKDFGVTGPPGSDTIGLKVAETLALKVSVFGSTEPPPTGLEADEPAESSRRLPPPKRPASQPKKE